MNIKEIIDAERWEAGDHGLAPMPSVEHNAALDRIEAAVVSAGCLDEEAMDEFIFKQAELIAELEVTTIIDGDMIKNLKQRIAELEAQPPKTVNPRMVANHWKCKCGAVLYPGKQHPETKKQWVPKYCMDCGSKLNWEDA